MINEEEVQKSYANALRTAKGSGSSCCSPSTNEIRIDDILFTDSTTIPSFGCVKLDEYLKRELQLGDTVIDLGSGAGHDLFIAADLVGSRGKAIGIDFTDEMVAEVEAYVREHRIENVLMIKGNIDRIPLANGIADKIISNCVINLAMDKDAVFKEAFRLLRPGGSLIDADVISIRPMLESVKNDKSLWCSCIGGALTELEYRRKLQNTGFGRIDISFVSGSDKTFDATDFGIRSGIIRAQKLIR